MITDKGLDWGPKRWFSDGVNKMLYGAAGTGTNTPLPTDTALQTEKVRKTLTVITYPSAGKVHCEFVVDWTEMNNETITEVGIFDDPQAGTLLLRKLLDPPINKTSDKKPTIILEITVSRG